jgi:5-methylcytosine-specific restriction protein A
MYLGVMRLQFATGAREAVTQVLWKENEEHRFEPCSTTVGWKQATTGDGLEDLDLVEGRRYLISHLVYERSAKLVAAKKAAVLAATNKLACEACGFVFRDKYGVLGDGYCEVHHRVQVGKSGMKKTNLKDLAILCSNCHRMIHRSGPPMLSVEAFGKTCLTSGRTDGP